MSKKNTSESLAISIPEEDIGDVPAEVLVAAWMRKGQIEFAVQKLASIRELVAEKVAEARRKIEEAKAEIRKRSEAMEKDFAALGFPGGPPLDDAEAEKAKQRGVKVRPTPPSDNKVLRDMLVQRILKMQQEHPNNPAATRGLARWSGAAGERIKLVLKDAPEVTNTIDDRWVCRAPAEPHKPVNLLSPTGD